MPRWFTVLALLETGARYGELRQVRWRDIRLKEPARITLREGTTKGRAGKRHERSIPLSETLVDELPRLRAAACRVNGGKMPRGSDIAFLTPKGKPFPTGSRNLLVFLQRAYEHAGIAILDEDGHKLNVHTMRHTFATRLLRQGAAIQKVQKLLGHRTLDMLIRIYNHLEDEDTRDAIEALPRLIARSETDVASTKRPH
ncbi:MAG: site-specific integrase, partial [bacterium]|nr:site-specific integrase [bacterium]